MRPVDENWVSNWSRNPIRISSHVFQAPLCLSQIERGQLNRRIGVRDLTDQGGSNRLNQ